MENEFKLKRIPLEEYDYCKYEEAKSGNIDNIEFYYQYKVSLKRVKILMGNSLPLLEKKCLMHI